jgi:N-acetyl-gamma-glutamyl-phosphate reductase
MKKYKIYVDGQTGTTGLEINERLSRFSASEIEILEIDNDKRRDINTRKEFINNADLVFLCLPDDAARESVQLLENKDTRVIDASTAHRTHTDWAYGIPELSPEHRNKIKSSRFVSNPGCHATALIVPLFPLLKNGLIPNDYHFSFTSITGHSGGGKKLIADYADSSNENLKYPRQYALNLNHKHMPEIIKYLDLKHDPLFMPVVCNYYKGLQVSIPIFRDLLAKKTDAKEIHSVLSDYYRSEKFIRIHKFEDIQEFPVYQCNNTNYMDICVIGKDDRILILSCLDNLGKGASGAAVQNMNLMLGFDEDHHL